MNGFTEGVRLSQVASGLPSRKEAARYLGVEVHTLAVWHSTRRYKIPVVKIGRLVKYRKIDLDVFIMSRRVS